MTWCGAVTLTLSYIVTRTLSYTLICTRSYIVFLALSYIVIRTLSYIVILNLIEDPYTSVYLLLRTLQKIKSIRYAHLDPRSGSGMT